MGLILSLDNSIHSFNTGKFVLDQYTGAAAAYSLRRLSVNSTNVVRVRRSVDNAEDDFTADEVADGTMLNWVNADMPLPLDTATAAAAYSLRNLKTSYTGSVIRVRRSSDNAEADFTADEITDGTLLAWVGNTASDNGYVTTWYDQAGSNSATQGTAANQPKIVDAGVLVEENGRPALEFTTSTEMLTSASGTYSQPNTYFIIAKNNNVNSDFIDGSILVDRNLNDINSGFHRMFAALSFQSTFPNTANQFLRYSLFDGASSEIAIDAASVETGDVGFQGLEKSFRIGDNTSAFLMQELIIYNSDQSSNRTNIETNINDYYSIYAQDRDGFVTTWYDQSGNSNDATQGTAANQPKIVDAGGLIISNGYTVIEYDGTNDNLTTSLTATGTMLMSGSDGGDFYEVAISGSYNLLADASLTDHPLRESIRVIWSSSLTTAQKTAIENLITYTDWDFSDVTSFIRYWFSRNEITQFPLIDISSGTVFNNAWRNCSSLTTFPLLDVSSGSDFIAAWRDCNSLTSFPKLNLSSGTAFSNTWLNCSSLTDFPANMFDSVTATNFTSAFTSTNLSSQSIENIVVSIDTAGQINGTLNITGGGNSTTATAQTAIDNLRGRGWTVTVPDGY